MDFSCREMVADEKLVRDKVHLFCIQQDGASPPAFEVEKARAFGVHVRIDVVLFCPVSVGRIVQFEIMYEPRAVENSVAQISDHRVQPRAQACRPYSAWDFFHAHPPIREGCAREDKDSR
jgi:hypothetical protein